MNPTNLPPSGPPTDAKTVPWHKRPSGPLRKMIAAVIVVGCLILSVVGGLLPILQGWLFFVIGLYVLATEFETGRKWVRMARRRWPSLSRHIGELSKHRWAPRHLKEFEELTDPAR